MGKYKNYKPLTTETKEKETTESTATTTGTKATTYGYYSSSSKNYDFRGIKNSTSFAEFVNICKLNQSQLKSFLEARLKMAGYAEIISGDGYLYAKGIVPVLLTAHMDTVHDETVKDFYEYYDKEKNQHIISSPQGIGGDDRCGIYMILQIIQTHKCSILFCEDEESGGIGSSKFCKTEFINELSDLKYMIELDRANGKDAVFYDCANDEFIKFIEDNTGFKEAYGSFSDISNLAPCAGIAAVNLSCGYYNAHRTSEYVIIEEMLNTIEVVKKLLDVECEEQFIYIESVYSYGRGYGYSRHSSYGCSIWDDDYDDYSDYYSDYYSRKYGSSNSQAKTISLIIYIYNENMPDFKQYVVSGSSEFECFGRFFIKNSDYSYNDVYDYDIYNGYICEDGWLN